MTVMTRSQYSTIEKQISTNRFEKTITNPCVLNIIIQHLTIKDLIAMKQISKDNQFIDTIDHTLTKIRSKEIRKKKLIKKIKNYLNHISSLNFFEDKKHILIKLYNLIYQNSWFINENENFGDVVHDNLFKNMFQNHLFIPHSIKFLNKLFHLEHPKDFYNSQLGIKQYGMFNKYGKFVELPK